ncbi:hypothetical protein C0036_10295, partial [Streptomyces sp. DJ]
MVTMRQLEKPKFGALGEAVESWRESSARLDYHREEVDRSMRAPLKEQLRPCRGLRRRSRRRRPGSPSRGAPA